MKSPEQLADQYVSLDVGGQGGGHRVLLTVPGEGTVRLGWHANPTLARAEAAAVRRFLAAVLRTAVGVPAGG